MLIVAELCETLICGSVKCDLLQFSAHLIKLNVKFLRGLVQLHELVEGANLELGFINLKETVLILGGN